MLPPANRLRRSDDFGRVTRYGAAAGSSLVVVHLLPPEASPVDSTGPGTLPCSVTRVGFAVGKPVGTAVVRNRARRRLRHIMASHVSSLPAGTQVVVRARLGAGDADSTALAQAVDSALARAQRKAAAADTVRYR